jgi:hypothetical protein
VKDEQSIDDTDLLDIAHGDQVRARSLRNALMKLADSDDPALRELGREVLSGRIGIREAVRSPAYAEALSKGVESARRHHEQSSPEERREQEAAARRYQGQLRAEIEAEKNA